MEESPHAAAAEEPPDDNNAVYVLETKTIMAYSGTWPVGIATREQTWWICRRFVDPYKLQVEEQVFGNERRAVQWLRASRWTCSTKKVRLPVRVSSGQLSSQAVPV